MASTMVRLHCRAPARVCEGLVMVLAAVLYDTSLAGVEAFVPPTGLVPSRVLHARSTTPTESESGSRTREACGWATTVALQAKGGNIRRGEGEGGAFYRELGVKRTAQADEIRSAYLKLAKKLHPDVSADPADAAKFKRITAAYEVLSDEEQRYMYDQDLKFDSMQFGRTPQAFSRRRKRSDAEEDAPASPLVIAGTGLLMISIFKSIFGAIA